MPRSIRKSSSKKSSLGLRLISFGYKHGRDVSSDLIFDVRFLPNPFYVASLKAYSGRSKKIQKYIFSHPQAVRFLDKVRDLIDLLIPEYIRKGKKSLKIAFGCTGGRHRSVAMAERLLHSLRKKGIPCQVTHRDEKG